MVLYKRNLSNSSNKNLFVAFLSLGFLLISTFVGLNVVNQKKPYSTPSKAATNTTCSSYVYSTQWSAAGSRPLASPLGSSFSKAAIDPRLYVANSQGPNGGTGGNGNMHRYGPGGTPSTVVGDYYPMPNVQDISTDSNGYSYTLELDSLNRTSISIYKVTDSSVNFYRTTVVLPGSGADQLNQPKGSSARVIPGGTASFIYVADTLNNRLVKYSCRTDRDCAHVYYWNSPLPTVGSMLNPYDITVEENATTQRMYVSDTGHNRILKSADITGAAWSAWGSSGTGNGQFNSPRGIAVDYSGYVYVADTGNNRIQVFTPDGVFWAKISGGAEGAFSQPRSVAVDSTGAVYVTDTGHNRIVKYICSATSPTPSNRVPEWISHGLGNFCIGSGIYASSVQGKDYNANDTLTATLTGLPSGIALRGCTSSVVGTEKRVDCAVSGGSSTVGSYTVTAKLCDQRSACDTETWKMSVYKPPNGICPF